MRPGALIAVIGAVGSGKSSLLSAVLGEMHRSKGTQPHALNILFQSLMFALFWTAGEVRVSGRIAYTSQENWIRNDTLRCAPRNSSARGPLFIDQSRSIAVVVVAQGQHLFRLRV